MKFGALIVASAATALLLTAPLAYAGDEYCPPVKKIKVNSGVGNGSEFGPNESADADPGNSGGNNNAGDNYTKPKSPGADDVMP
jgi:hypothetical protein